MVSYPLEHIFQKNKPISEFWKCLNVIYNKNKSIVKKTNIFLLLYSVYISLTIMYLPKSSQIRSKFHPDLLIHYNCINKGLIIVYLKSTEFLMISRIVKQFRLYIKKTLNQIPSPIANTRIKPCIPHAYARLLLITKL